jgi:cytochrome b6-f complex iron-sulfur subunit
MDNDLTAPTQPIPGKKIPVNRREFLNLAWLASLGIVTVVTGGATFFFALPRLEEGEFGGLFTIPRDSLPSLADSPAGYPKGKFWMSHTEGGLSAFYMVCTHLGCIYSWLDNQGHFRCPCHGSEFRKDGSWQYGPAPRNLDQFVIQLTDPATGEIVAQTDLENPAPLALPDDPNLIVSVDTGELLRGQRK